uniref:Integrase catalytic domain-containing protein n=1 Tax=Salarias fasciatus TaxID=181472 RepID=A0A672GHB8_SALFA
MALMKEGIGQAHIYTDSWSVANGLLTWMPTWHKNNWTIHNKKYGENSYGLTFGKSAEATGLAQWAHEKAGHWVIKGTMLWAQDHGIGLMEDHVKSVLSKCERCQHQRKGQPQRLQGQIHRGKAPGQIWQVDFIGPLPWSAGSRYVCTAVDTYSGLGVLMTVLSLQA